MNPVDIIVVAVIALIVGGAVFYIVKEKKRGRKCIGCPYSSQCGKSGKSIGCSCCGKSELKSENTDNK